MTARRHGFDNHTDALDAAAHGFWMHHALNQIENETNDRVSVEKRRASNRKFGRTSNADNGIKTTIMNLAGAERHETYLTSNLIDSVSSDAAGDTQVLVVEGCTIDANNDMAALRQEVTLTGLTEATLATPLVRVDKVYIKNGTFAVPAVTNVGTIYVYDNTGVTLVAGVPDDDTAVKLMILPGLGQSQKGATTVAAADYLIITGLDVSISRSTAVANADVEIEWREQGGVWRSTGLEIALRSGATNAAFVHIEPYVVIPPNSDVRLVATASADNSTIRGHLDAVVAEITGQAA